MTVQEIVDEIIGEVGGQTTDTVLAARIFGFLKSGLRHIPAFIRDRTFTNQGTVTLVSGNYEVSLSTLTGFIKERAVWRLNENSDRIIIDRPPSLEYFNRVFSPLTSGTPLFYIIYNRLTMQFDKKANANITIGLDYFKAISSVALVDTFNGNEQLVEAAKHFAKIGYYTDYEEDMAKANAHRSDGAALIMQLEEDYVEQELGGSIEETSY